LVSIKLTMNRPPIIFSVLLGALLGSANLSAQTTDPIGEPAGEPIRLEGSTPGEIESGEIEEVTIIGEAAGPGLWKVRNGDNTLYLLGTLSPLPKKLQWRSREVENVLSRAKQIIPARSDVDADIGPIKAVQLYLQYRKLRGNSENQSLEAVLPPDVFGRFEALRAAGARHAETPPLDRRRRALA
jgi:hypothetical protein